MKIEYKPHLQYHRNGRWHILGEEWKEHLSPTIMIIVFVVGVLVGKYIL